MQAEMTVSQWVRGLCSCLKCRRAVRAGPDPFPPLYEPTLRERSVLWSMDPSLTFGPGHPGNGAGFHLCFPHPAGREFL